MELTITHTEERPLLKRKELTARIFFEGTTPRRVAVLEALAKTLKADEKLLVIDTIHTVFGETAATVKARLYSDAAVMKRLERENLLAKHVKPAKPVAEESAAEAE